MISLSALELEERRKYNNFVEFHNYGSDKYREKQVDRICHSLGKVSERYVRILSSMMLLKEIDPLRILKRTQDNNKVLDIGSGPGGVMNWLSTYMSADVYGIDISDNFVNTLKANFPNLDPNKVFVCNARDLSIFEDSKFHIVQHCDGMEHIPDVWEVDCLKEAVRVSSRYIFYETSTGDATADAWATRGYTYEGAHVNIKTGEEWLDFYKKHSEDMCYDIKDHYTNPEENSFAIILEKRS